MVSFFIFMTWLALEVIDVYMPPGKHNVDESYTINQKLNSSWPLNSIDESQFYVAYQVHSGQYNTTATGSEDQYFSGIWVQRENGIPTNYFVAKPCPSLYEQQDVSQMFWQQIQGYMCPYMRGSKVKIQNFSPANSGNSSSDFFFVLDTCAHLAEMTNRTDCKTEAESQAVLESIYVRTKIHTEFWNTKNFLRNGWQMNSEFQQADTQLNTAVF